MSRLAAAVPVLGASRPLVERADSIASDRWLVSGLMCGVVGTRPQRFRFNGHTGVIVQRFTVVAGRFIPIFSTVGVAFSDARKSIRRLDASGFLASIIQEQKANHAFRFCRSAVTGVEVDVATFRCSVAITLLAP
jgi:hypothetical protein